MSSRHQVNNQAKAQALALMGGRAFLILLAVLAAGIFLALTGTELAFCDAGFAAILSVTLAGVVMAVLGSLRDHTAWLIARRPPGPGIPVFCSLPFGRQLVRPHCTFRPPRFFS